VGRGAWRLSGKCAADNSLYGKSKYFANFYRQRSTYSNDIFGDPGNFIFTAGAYGGACNARGVRVRMYGERAESGLKVGGRTINRKEMFNTPAYHVHWRNGVIFRGEAPSPGRQNLVIHSRVRRELVCFPNSFPLFAVVFDFQITKQIK